MSITDLISLPGTLTAITAGEIDEYGDATDTPSTTAVPYWLDDPAAHGDTDWSNTERRVFFRPGTTVTAGTQFTDRDGDTYVLQAGFARTHPRSGECLFVVARAERVA